MACDAQPVARHVVNGAYRMDMAGELIAVARPAACGRVNSRAKASGPALSSGKVARFHRVTARTGFIFSYEGASVGRRFVGPTMSGVGRENSKATSEHCSQLKPVNVRVGDAAARF